jgi:hypothetical protein
VCATLVALFILLLLAPLGARSATPAATQKPEKLVMAFHYTWFTPEDFNKGQMSDRPVQPYRSSEPATLERQVLEAKSASIDAFVTAWTGPGTETDRIFAGLLDIAARHGFKIALHMETSSIGGDKAEALNAAARYYAHPAYLRAGGKPVLFVWSPQTVGNPAAWVALRGRVDPNRAAIWSVDTTDVSYLDAFDSLHLFSAGKWNPNTDLTRENARWRAEVDAYNKRKGTARLWTAGVIPGWDETRVQPPRQGAKQFPRRDGALYTESWNGAIASNPDLITITSFNEWFEGSQIEPSASYGRKYLDMTVTYARLFKFGPDPCDGGTHFRETGFSICKKMEAYWRQYGGLAQFGFPISAAIDERNSADGKTYRVQYFERARMELHPENVGTQYEVLLGLLGKQFHAPDPPAARLPTGHQYFAETGHNVPTVFYDYWRTHGGLFVNGYPISEPVQERGSDGKMYLVQYFERARYEHHPELAAPFNVLLGHLGRQAWETRKP